MADLIKVEEVKNIFSSFPEIVNQNTTSVEKCNQAGKALLDTIDAEGMNDVLDEQCALYLKKAAKTVQNLNKRRLPLTQIFDEIRSKFTAMEKEIDVKSSSSIPFRIKAQRDAYAKKKYEEEQRRKEEAARKAAYNNEVTQYKIAVENELNSYFNRYLSDRVETLNNIFRNINLNDFHKDSIAISVFLCDYPKSHFEQFYCNYPTTYLSRGDKDNIKNSVVTGKYVEFANIFKSKINEVKQELTDRLPSKKKELEELEQIRKRDAEAFQRAEAERKQREAEQAKRQLEELRLAEERRKKEAEMKAQQAQVNDLFNQSASAVPFTPVNAKVKRVIKVLAPQGFLEIFQMWWVNEGQNLSMEDLQKLFKKQITFCEKECNKSDITIKSSFISYEDEIKAK